MSRFAYDKITKQSTLIAGSTNPVVIAGTENGTTASQAYTVGQYLVYGGFLYKVISAIAQGDTLTVGTNISVTTVGNEITDIHNNLTASNATAGVTDVPFRFGCDDDGNFGYIITEGGADTVVPFRSGGSLDDIYNALVAKGFTPADKTSEDIVAAINAIPKGVYLRYRITEGQIWVNVNNVTKAVTGGWYNSSGGGNAVVYTSWS